MRFSAVLICLTTKSKRGSPPGNFGLLKSAIAMQKEGDLTPAQSIMAANAPMIIQKAMVDGHPDEGVLPSGQVAGVIDRLPSCAELIEEIVGEAEEQLERLASRVG